MSKSTRVVLVTDSRTVAEKLRDLASYLSINSKRKYSFKCTFSVTDAIQTALNRKADVVIVDANIKAHNPIEIAKEIKKQKGIGVIVLCTNENTKESAIQSQVSGADDYLLLSNTNSATFECAVDCALMKSGQDRNSFSSFNATIPTHIAQTLDRLDSVSKLLLLHAS